MSDKQVTFEKIKDKITLFVEERDWKKFHSPKNISVSIAIEAAELMEIYQWLTNDESLELHLDKSKKKKIEEEIADIGIYLFNLCTILDIDLSDAIKKKLLKNSEKYPVRLVKGKAHKYTYYKKENNAKRSIRKDMSKLQK